MTSMFLSFFLQRRSRDGKRTFLSIFVVKWFWHGWIYTGRGLGMARSVPKDHKILISFDNHVIRYVVGPEIAPPNRSRENGLVNYRAEGVS